MITPGMIRIREVSALPEDAAELAAAAQAEGFRFVARLVREYATGENAFAAPGEALFEVRSDGRLVAIGGLNLDPYRPEGSVGRLRRLFVRPAFRGCGIGRALVQALEARAADTFDELRLFTDSERAARFYEQLGYAPLPGCPEASHAKRLRG